MKGIARVSVGLVCLSFLVITVGAPASPRLAQAETPVATLTGTPEGPQILVPDQVNVRICPKTECDLVGVLIAGQQASAIGRSPGGDWIQIIYPGVPGNVAWVYSHYVVLPPGQSLLPIVEPLPTSTPNITPTVDPTLAAQFNLGGAITTPLPTFTAAAPVFQPTFEPAQDVKQTSFPPILAILALTVLGLFGVVISVLRGSSAGL
ncbi:MAG: hypothetical protein A2Z14_16345 [Chloroflexi bacterium RBG_16_48_8]|nr:MAG: hypothetical protein A2Z14_16345 [Chloroflexi bacterium RBG_16_48_8]